ncbi:MAG: MFS transporter [Gemmatimonadales bacterium]
MRRLFRAPNIVAQSGSGRISKAYARYAVVLLALINIVNYLDRNVIFVLFEPIKRDLGLTDTQLGWLGAAFVIVFSLAAIPLGILSDLKSRRAVIAGGVMVWSVFTALGGLTRNFFQLFVCRSMVGVGEAAYSPAAQSLIADFFPSKGRALALGIFSGGLALGGVAGIWLGGELEHLYGWRAAFLAVGIPGFVLAMLVAQLRDPTRYAGKESLWSVIRRFELTVWRFLKVTWPLSLSAALGAIAAYLVQRAPLGAGEVDLQRPDLDAAVFSIAVGIGLVVQVTLGVRAVLRRRHEPRAVRSHRVEDLIEAAGVVLRTPTLVWLFLGSAMISFAMNGLVGWSPTYLQREMGLIPQTAGRTIGIWGLAGAILGVLFGGQLADSLKERFRGGRIIAGAAGFIMGAPLAIWLLTIDDLELFIPVFFITMFFFTWYHGPMSAAIFDVIPPQIGASVIGAYVFFTHIAGDAVAFPLVGFLSDRVGIRLAMMVLPFMAFAGGGVALVATLTVGKDMNRVGGATAG